jgi:hypothetical protein
VSFTLGYLPATEGPPTEADAALGFSPNQNGLNLVET